MDSQSVGLVSDVRTFKKKKKNLGDGKGWKYVIIYLNPFTVSEKVSFYFCIPLNKSMKAHRIYVKIDQTNQGMDSVWEAIMLKDRL